jgi:cytochrome c-type biogenesis protein CcmH/NrfF
MEGNTLMNEMRQLVFKLLRQGESITQILQWQDQLKEELLTMKDYVKAMQEADFAP